MQGGSANEQHPDQTSCLGEGASGWSTRMEGQASRQPSNIHCFPFEKCSSLSRRQAGYRAAQRAAPWSAPQHVYISTCRFVTHEWGAQRLVIQDRHPIIAGFQQVGSSRGRHSWHQVVCSGCRAAPYHEQHPCRRHVKSSRLHRFSGSRVITDAQIPDPVIHASRHAGRLHVRLDW